MFFSLLGFIYTENGASQCRLVLDMKRILVNLFRYAGIQQQQQRTIQTSTFRLQSVEEVGSSVLINEMNMFVF